MIDSRKAFSLLEILVAIAIAGTLVALLVPALGKMRISSDRTTCLSNLRTLGLGIQAFAQDNKGQLPLSLQPDPQDPGSSATVSWQVLILRELGLPFPKRGDRSVFICPAWRVTYPQPAFRTYGLNLAGDSPTENPPRLFTLSRPSQTALVLETKHEADGAGYNALSRNINGTGGKVRLEGRHQGKMNILMADGSVQSMDVDDPNIDNFLLNIRQ